MTNMCIFCICIMGENSIKTQFADKSMAICILYLSFIKNIQIEWIWNMCYKCTILSLRIKMKRLKSYTLNKQNDIKQSIDWAMARTQVAGGDGLEAHQLPRPRPDQQLARPRVEHLRTKVWSKATINDINTYMSKTRLSKYFNTNIQ